MKPRTRWGFLIAQASSRVPEDLKEALRLAALANDVSMSEVLRRALERETKIQISKLKKGKR